MRIGVLRYYVCLNQISYLVACEHAEQEGRRDSLILIDAARVSPQTRYRDCATLRITRLLLIRCLLKALLDRHSVAYIPHHKTGRLVQWLAAAAAESHLLDDGMDSLRDRPRNIDVSRIAGRKLLTFSEYERLGAWAVGLRRVSVCSLMILARDERPPLEVDGFAIVIIESPGVLSRAEATPGIEATLYVSHPSSIKQLAAPPYAAIARAGRQSVERALIGFRGRIVVGETMILPFLLYCVPQPAIEVELLRAQYLNLTALHPHLVADRVALKVH